MADADFEKAAATYSELTEASRDETAASMIDELDRLDRKIFKGQSFKDAIRRMNMIAEGQLLATGASLAGKSDEMHRAGQITDELLLSAVRKLANDSYGGSMTAAFREQWAKTPRMMRDSLFEYGPANGLSQRDLAVRKYEIGARLNRWFLETVGTVPWDRYFTPAISLFGGKLVGHALTSPSGGRLPQLAVPYDKLQSEVAQELG